MMNANANANDNDNDMKAVLTEDIAMNNVNPLTAMSIGSASSGQHSDGYVDGFVKTYTASTTSTSNQSTPPSTQMSNMTYGATSSLPNHGVGGDGWSSVLQPGNVFAPVPSLSNGFGGRGIERECDASNSLRCRT